MFKRLFTKKARREDIERFVNMEYRIEDRNEALTRLLREAGYNA